MLMGLRPYISGSADDAVPTPTPTGPSDPYYASVYCLYHLDTDYSDSGPAGNAIQATNTSANYGIQSTTTKFGAGALRSTLNNAGGTLVKIPPNAALNGTGDITFEFWMRSAGTQGTYSNMFETLGAATLGTVAPPATALGVANWTNAAGTGTGGTTLTMYLGSGATQLRLTSISNPNNGNWHHIALTRSGNTCTLWFNGVAERTGSYTVALDLGGQYGMSVGRYTNTDNTNIYNGYLDDIRITLGVARYTSNFAVPTAEHPNNG